MMFEGRAEAGRLVAQLASSTQHCTNGSKASIKNLLHNYVYPIISTNKEELIFHSISF